MFLIGFIILLVIAFVKCAKNNKRREPADINKANGITLQIEPTGSAQDLISN